jgi:hypothetical protein
MATDLAQKWLKLHKDEDLHVTTLNQSQIDASSSVATNSSYWASLIQEGIK